MKNRIYAVSILLLFFGLKGQAQAPTLTRGPYLQVVTPTSVIVRWRTNQPTTGRVWFGASANQLTGSLSESQPTLDHTLTLTGLQPATRYVYAVGYDNTQLASGPDYYVKTALPTGDTRPFRMWVLGDFGYPGNWQQPAYQAYRNATTTRPADLWVWLGDNAYCCGADDQYQQYVFDVYGSTFRNTPIFICPGNHDYSDSNTNFNIPYYNLFDFPQQAEAGGVPSGSKSYFSANYGNVHLISLDSQGQKDGDYRLYDTTSTQVQWLKRDLAANRQPWTIVIFHHPPYSKGSHNSDTETQMRLLRENLTPILERYGVDIVFNGHSHGYERYYRMKGQIGLANTFNKATHVAENTTARYDGSPNSCPVLTKGQGTVYIVDGAGGAPGGQQADYPHPAMVYGNQTNAGSLLLDVTDNRLDGQYLLGDGTTPDRFTIMKNVNKTASFTAEFADTLQFAASWVGNYRWPGGQTSRNFRYIADRAGTFPINVSDNQQCLADQFTVTVQQPPKLTTKISTASSVCVGSTIPVTAISENTTKAAGWQYDVLLSDATGNFSPERIVGSGTVAMLKATIPVNLTPGSGYRLRVRPRGIPYAQLVSSDAFAINSIPAATLTGPATVLQGQPVSLTVTFTGYGPWTGRLSDGTSFSATTSPAIIPIQVTKSITYSLMGVANGCGQGAGSGQVSINVILPKITARTSTSACAGGRLPITALIENAYQATDWQYDVLLSNALGQFATETIVGSGPITALMATLPPSLPAGMDYRLRVRPRNAPNAELISSDGFTVKPLATATLTGSTTVLQGSPVSLTLSFTGEGPWQGTLSSGLPFSFTENPTILIVRPEKSSVYSVANVENSCGKGTVSGEAIITVLLLTDEEVFAGGRLRIYPNPAQDVLHVELTTPQKKEVSLTIRDLNGRSVFQKSFGLTASLSETITLPNTAGTYLLTVQAGETRLTRQIVRQ